MLDIGVIANRRNRTPAYQQGDKDCPKPHIACQLIQLSGQICGKRQHQRQRKGRVPVANCRAAGVQHNDVHHAAQPHARRAEQHREQRVFPLGNAMAALRTPVDKLEMLVDKDLWPMPSYGDLIFEV